MILFAIRRTATASFSFVLFDGSVNLEAEGYNLVLLSNSALISKEVLQSNKLFDSSQPSFLLATACFDVFINFLSPLRM